VAGCAVPSTLRRTSASLPDRAALLARVTELTAGSVTVRGFAAAGEYVFFLRQDGGGGVPVLAVRDSESSRAAGSAGEGGHEGWNERVLLDPARFRRRGGALQSGLVCAEPRRAAGGLRFVAVGLGAERVAGVGCGER